MNRWRASFVVGGQLVSAFCSSLWHQNDVTFSYLESYVILISELRLWQWQTLGPVQPTCHLKSANHVYLAHGLDKICLRSFLSIDENHGKPLILDMQEYKNLTWVGSAARKFRPKGHCLVSRGFAMWCEAVIQRGGFSVHTEHSFLILFLVYLLILNVLF